jgi:hypothetical protein
MCPGNDADAAIPENKTQSLEKPLPVPPIMQFSFDDPLFMEAVMLTVEKMKLEEVQEPITSMEKRLMAESKKVQDERMPVLQVSYSGRSLGEKHENGWQTSKIKNRPGGMTPGG